MKIGYGNFWVEVKPTIEQIIDILTSIWRELNMNIPLWLFLLLIICIYIYIWRVKVSEWKIKNAMAKIWRILLEIRDTRVGMLREKGMDQIQIDNLNLTKHYEWDQIFNWSYPSCKPSIIWFIKRRKHVKT